MILIYISIEIIIIKENKYRHNYNFYVLLSNKIKIKHLYIFIFKLSNYLNVIVVSFPTSLHFSPFASSAIEVAILSILFRLFFYSDLFLYFFFLFSLSSTFISN